MLRKLLNRLFRPSLPDFINTVTCLDRDRRIVAILKHGVGRNSWSGICTWTAEVRMICDAYDRSLPMSKYHPELDHAIYGPIDSWCVEAGMRLTVWRK